MSTCCWCTPGGPATVKLLANFASGSLSPKDVSAANEDLCYCLECVEEYHKARDEVPSLHQALWDWEVSRLVVHFETSMRGDDESDIYLVEEDRVTPFTFCNSGPNFEKRLRVPLLEVLKYPYLLLHEHLSELCVDALCKMEEMNYSYQVVGKHPGIYLLMVHPNETIRRWAILTARSLGKVDRDDYYDIQEVLICLFKVVELGLFENPDIYSSTGVEKTRLVLLPPHLYDTGNYKNYWLGLCMLLSVLEEQAMDSLLLGPDKQNFVQSIMNTMRKPTEDEIHDPFWPVLHCFMVILDKLGSKVWGQLVDPVQAFQTIINNPSYKKEIESIRHNCSRAKSEPPSDYDDETITCSQLVYNYNPERPNKDSRLRTTACLDYCPNFYEEMQTLSDMFQYDIGRDMRLHHSTFLWFIPFVSSLMDLKGLGVAYSMVVIQHLCSEVKEVLHRAIQTCDKVSQFFIWILVTVVELSWKKRCFDTLWLSSQNWVEVVVTCAGLPSVVFTGGADLPRNAPRSLMKVPSRESDSIRSVCMNLIRVLLKEGCQMRQKASPFLDELNLVRRSHEDWKLSAQQARELQTCLMEIIRRLRIKSMSTSTHGQDTEEEGRNPSHPPQEHSTYQSLRKQDEVFQEGVLSKKKFILDEEAKGEPSHQRNSEFHLTNIKHEHKQSLIDGEPMLHSTSTEGTSHSTLDNHNSSVNQSGFVKDFQKKDTTGKEEKPRITNPDLHPWPPGGSALEEKQIPKMTAEDIAGVTLKLKRFVENRKRLLGAESEKQQSVKEDKQDHQEGTAGRTARESSGSTSNCLPCKLPLSSENGFQAKIISMKKEPVEFQSAWKTGDSGESCMDDLPFVALRKDLASKKLLVHAMEPEIDREGQLHSDARQESTLTYQNPIQRKVQGAFRSLPESKSQTWSPGAGGPSSQVIIISDTSSDEEENKVNVTRRSQEENASGPLRKHLKSNKEEVISLSSSPLTDGECESQCFEFETEDEIYSAWQDSQLDQAMEEDVFPGETAGKSASSELARCLSEQGDDTDTLGDDDVEKAEQELEEQKKVGQTQTILPVQADDENVGEGNAAVCSKYFTAAHDDATESSRPSSPSAFPMPQSSSSSSSSAGPSAPALEPTPGPKKSLAKSKGLDRDLKSPEERKPVTDKPLAHVAPSGLLLPFVVPPKKIHHFPEPTSTTEKLGLKKKPRKAAELSQHSHDVLAQLRSYGKTAGQLPSKSRKAKLIEPRRMVIRNKALLASQERQFFRQSRSEKKGKGEDVPRANKIPPKSPVESADKKEVDNVTGKPNQPGSTSNQLKRLLPQHPQEDDGSRSAAPETEPLPSSRQEAIKPDSEVPGCSTLTPGSVDSSSEVGRVANSGASSKNLSEDASGSKGDLDPEENEDDLFLTQRDLVDMELCSQTESTSGPEDLNVLPALQDQPQAAEKCRHLGCPNKAEGAGAFCQGHSLPNPPDHVFAKPSLPPKPSTKKIFSSSASSRMACLSKDLEMSSMAPPKTKFNPNLFAALKGDNVRTKLTLANLLCPRNNVNSVPAQPHGVQTSHGVGNASETPVPRSNAGREARLAFAQVISSHNQPRDHSIFTKEILKWSYDMFTSFKDFGPPSHLLQAVVNSVPVKFHNYDDYFKIFFPLMILNAFEEVTCEWLDNQKLRDPKPIPLTLLNFNMDLNKADFTAEISQHEIENQQHPKDDDLVFLIVSDKRFYYDERDEEKRVARHVGFVTRFFQPSFHNTKKKEQQVTCHLSIQTQGNLSRIEKEVKCMLVSSLATTHRRFQALLMLNRSPLATPILCPSAPYFSPRDLNTEPEKSLPYMKEFNEGQKRAIETAYAMITQHPASPKVCLIHGPPGTGKSKVIVGLLHRILGERSGKDNSIQRLNAKIKTHRVLVCAPSNAAIDNLMKKIILGFKKYREKNALGNCGDINLVRLGQQKSINSEVRKFSLDDQIDRKINKAMLGKDQDLQKKKEDLDRRLDALSRLRAMDRSESGEKKQQLEDEICQLSKERQRLASQLKEGRGRSQELKASIILESHIICCTLSTSGGVLLKSAFRRLGGDPVSCVIVDEAGQTCEVETLIPLIHGCKKLVLVGDPKQLPPTIKSLKAQDYRYDQSMIGRLCKHLKEQDQENISGKFPVLQLSIQYRMHPEICLFPSKYVYEGALTTDRKIAEDRFSMTWPFQPYLLFDVIDSREERENDSYSNPQEVKLLAELMKVIKGKKKDIGSRQIGIITPYNAQKRRIRRQLDKEFGENSVGEVDTVDGFQGREKDCIIVTCVRANSSQGSIGFLRSLQRLNVTITRAKYSLFILGKLKTLMENRDWNEMIQDAQRRGNIIQTSKNTYKASALKILKSRPLPPHLATAAPGPPAALSAGAKPPALPNPDPQRPPVSLPTLAGKTTPQEAPHQRPPPVAQVKPIQDRPQDPRLFRRVESALTAADGKEGQSPPTLGPSLVQNPSGHLATQSRSYSVDSPGGTLSHVSPIPGIPLPSDGPSTNTLDNGLSLLTEQLLAWKNYQRIVEMAQEKGDCTEPKRRRTTF